MLITLKARGPGDYYVNWFRDYRTEISHRLFDVDGDGVQEILVSMEKDGVKQTAIVRHPDISGNVVHDDNPAVLSCLVAYNGASPGIITITISSLSAYKLELYDIQGVKRYSRNYDAPNNGKQNIALEVYNNSSGILYLALTNDERIVIKKIILVK